MGLKEKYLESVQVFTCSERKTQEALLSQTSRARRGLSWSRVYSGANRNRLAVASGGCVHGGT